MSAEQAGMGREDWLETPAGQYILEWEQRIIDRTVADIFGYHALQLGMPQLASLRENRMPFHVFVNELGDPLPAAARPALAATRATGLDCRQIVARFDDLPFATQSVDLVTLPHVLESSDEPHQVLREVERILVPEGKVVLTGFNHLSLWGARQAGVRFGAEPFVPGQRPWIAFNRVKDWLKLLGLEVQRGRFGCYCPPLKTERWLQRTAFMEKAGDRWWPIFGAVYAITAVKRVRTLRLIGPHWRDARASHPALAPVVTPPPSRNGKRRITETEEN